MGAGADAVCVVYSKRTAKLMNSVELTADGKTAGLAEPVPKNLKEAEQDVEQGRTQKVKTGRQRFRWNLLFNLLLWALLPLPIWLPFVDDAYDMELSKYVVPGIQGAFMLFWLVVSFLAIRTAFVLYLRRNTDFIKLLEKDPKLAKKSRKLRHLVVLCCYKEPVELIADTVETVAAQTLSDDTTMVVSFEERTPAVRAKQGQLCEYFGKRFHEIIFTIHPYGTEGEIPGKCSNTNCGIRTAMAHMKRSDPDNFDPKSIIVTTCDADSKFHPRYLEALSYQYCKESKSSENCVFQAPLFYNWNLDALSFVTRVTGLVRAFLMMGALIPLNINSMSIFSFPASLCIAGDFIHPGYQMDDIIALIRWMGVCGRRLRIVPVPVPVLSGPTSGRVFEEEVEEWARQARRWTIGAGEVFHYFMVKVRNIPFFTALSWGITFILYYGVILCCSSIYGVVAGLSGAFLIKDDLTNWILLGLLGMQYLVFLIIFVLDRFTVRLIRPKVEERISLLRNAFQWLLSPLVLLGYSLVELYALHEVAILGKEVCKHGASKKDNLKK